MKRFWTLFGMVLLLVFPAGCGSGGGHHGDDSTGSTVSGVASKGPIKGGTVSVYEIGADGQKVEPALGTATTNDMDGSYSIDIGSYNGPVLVEIEGGRYKDEATGEDVDLTMNLRAAISNADGEVTVAVTPLTELAVREAEADGLTAENIESANKLISKLLGGDGTQDFITQILPVDVTDLDACDGAADNEKEYGLLLAALSQMANDTEKSVEEIIDEIKDDLQDLTLDDTGGVFSAALATFLDHSNNKTGIRIDDTDLDFYIIACTMDTYTIPLVDTIGIDGDGDDWDDVPAFPFPENGDMRVKLARDAGDNLYICISQPGAVVVPEGSYHYYACELSMIMPGDNADYWGGSLSFHWDHLGAFFLEAQRYDPDGYYDIETCQAIKTGDEIFGAEAKYPAPSYSKLAKDGSVNRFAWFSSQGERLTEIKFLPEAVQ